MLPCFTFCAIPELCLEQARASEQAAHWIGLLLSSSVGELCRLRVHGESIYIPFNVTAKPANHTNRLRAREKIKCISAYFFPTCNCQSGFERFFSPRNMKKCLVQLSESHPIPEKILSRKIYIRISEEKRFGHAIKATQRIITLHFYLLLQTGEWKRGCGAC